MANSFQQRLQSLSQGANARPFTGPFRPFPTGQPVEEDVGQETADVTSLIGGTMGLVVSPDQRARIQAAYTPLVRPVMNFLASPYVNMDPYAQWRFGLRDTMYRASPYQPTAQGYNAVQQAFLHRFANPYGGLSAASAGYKPGDIASIARQLAQRGLMPYLQSNPDQASEFTSAVARSMASLDERTGQKSTVDDLERVMGPLSRWLPNYQYLPIATRARLTAMGNQ